MVRKKSKKSKAPTHNWKVGDRPWVITEYRPRYKKDIIRDEVVGVGNEPGADGAEILVLKKAFRTRGRGKICGRDINECVHRTQEEAFKQVIQWEQEDLDKLIKQMWAMEFKLRKTKTVFSCKKQKEKQK